MTVRLPEQRVLPLDGTAPGKERTCETGIPWPARTRWQVPQLPGRRSAQAERVDDRVEVRRSWLRKPQTLDYDLPGKQPVRAGRTLWGGESRVHGRTTRKTDSQQKREESPKEDGTNNRDGLPAELEAYLNWWIISSLVILIAFPLTMLAIYCANLATGGLEAFSSAAMIYAASFLAGSLLGFLFGIPRALSSDVVSNSEERDRRLIANTNIEQISDWLTKIIVGATLVQLGNLARWFDGLTASLSSVFGNPTAQSKAMTGAIILYAAILGFFAAYIAARSIITFIFYLSPSDWIRGRQSTQAEKVASGTEAGQKTTQ